MLQHAAWCTQPVRIHSNPQAAWYACVVHTFVHTIALLSRKGMSTLIVHMVSVYLLSAFTYGASVLIGHFMCRYIMPVCACRCILLTWVMSCSWQVEKLQRWVLLFQSSWCNGCHHLVANLFCKMLTNDFCHHIACCTVYTS
jgi:hypothetical protein